jgi:hypothetical protein
MVLSFRSATRQSNCNYGITVTIGFAAEEIVLDVMGYGLWTP